MERAVARGLAVKEPGAPAHIGVDEKSAGRGQDYITVVSDLDKGTAEHIADERRTASLDGYFERLTDEQLAGIEAVAMDMWEPYANSVRAHLVDADDKTVFDRFNVMGYLGKAVDTVRKQENRTLVAEGDKSLTGSKYLRLYSAENLPRRHRGRFAALRNAGGVRGRSRRPSVTSGSTSAEDGPSATGRAGSSGRRTPASSRSSKRHTHSGATLTACSPSSTIASPTPVQRASTHAYRRSGSRPAATATGRTSRPRSTSISAVSTSTLKPTDDFPEAPQLVKPRAVN
jgi:hypothetical protein